MIWVVCNVTSFNEKSRHFENGHVVGTPLTIIAEILKWRSLTYHWPSQLEDILKSSKTVIFYHLLLVAFEKCTIPHLIVLVPL